MNKSTREQLNALVAAWRNRATDCELEALKCHREGYGDSYDIEGNECIAATLRNCADMLEAVIECGDSVPPVLTAIEAVVAMTGGKKCTS